MAVALGVNASVASPTRATKRELWTAAAVATECECDNKEYYWDAVRATPGFEEPGIPCGYWVMSDVETSYTLDGLGMDLD
ncbi:MAG: hypothetical protein IT433_08260, partial [Phycisphaerales bacterium]|nr:hypothetical protein [Phycisphaerales bacterium]